MSPTDPERSGRLAEALRANLRRRKAQARDRDAAPAIAPDDAVEDPGADAMAAVAVAPPPGGGLPPRARDRMA